MSDSTLPIRAQQLGDAEVRDLHPALLVEQDVLRLDVAVDDALLVRVLERLADGRHDHQRLLRRQLPRLQQLPQAHAVHKLHQQVIEAVGLAEVIDGDDVGMVEPGQGLRLAREPLGKARVFLLLAGQDLERHKAVEPRLARLIDHAHAAAAQAFENFQLRELAGDLLQRRRGFRLGGTTLRAAGPDLGPGRLGLGRQVQSHQAARAKALGRVGGQRRPAALALPVYVCILSHHPLIKKARGIVTCEAWD